MVLLPGTLPRLHRPVHVGNGLRPAQLENCATIRLAAAAVATAAGAPTHSRRTHDAAHPARLVHAAAVSTEALWGHLLERAHGKRATATFARLGGGELRR